MPKLTMPPSVLHSVAMPRAVHSADTEHDGIVWVKIEVVVIAQIGAAKAGNGKGVAADFSICRASQKST